MNETHWNLLIPPLVVLILGAGRMFAPKAPGWLVVLLAPPLGLLVDLIGANVISSWEGSGATAAALGMLATWLHQLGKQSIKGDGNKPEPDEESR